MPQPTISVSAPSRLHFGLFSVGDKVTRQYGGIGVMIDQPRTTICIGESDSFSVRGSSQAKIELLVQKWVAQYGKLVLPDLDVNQKPAVCVEITEQPPIHKGLGSGTQLALAVATALFRYFGLPLPKPADLSLALGRGGRSAIGTYGFFQGGLLVDRGTSQQEPVAPLDFRTEFPDEWPIVLSILREYEGLSGRNELRAFKNLPDVSEQLRQEMIKIVADEILPAIAAFDYESFANNLYHFGRRSGLFYQDIQGGPYNGERINRIVTTCREFGANATGQSSWGPCVFSICPDYETALQLRNHLDETYGQISHTMVTRADNCGAKTELVVPG